MARASHTALGAASPEMEDDTRGRDRDHRHDASVERGEGGRRGGRRGAGRRGGRAFGSSVTLLEAAPHILMSDDRDVSATVAAALHASGVDVVEDGGAIARFEPC